MSALNQIINSLFSPNSQSSTASETYIAHVPTFEQQPNSAERKPRFLILSGQHRPLPSYPCIPLTRPQTSSHARFIVKITQSETKRQRNLLNRQDVAAARPPHRRRHQTPRIQPRHQRETLQIRNCASYRRPGDLSRHCRSLLEKIQRW